MDGRELQEAPGRERRQMQEHQEGVAILGSGREPSRPGEIRVLAGASRDAAPGATWSWPRVFCQVRRTPECRPSHSGFAGWVRRRPYPTEATSSATGEARSPSASAM
jgi:hypothetical protein